MNTEAIIVSILAFLLGAVITAFGYTVIVSSKIASLGTELKNAVKQLEGVCSNINILGNKVDNLSERTTRLETQLGVKSA